MKRITKYLLILCAFIFNFSILAYAENVTGGEFNTLHNNNLSLRKTIERTLLENSRNYRTESYLVPNSTPIGQAVVAVEAFTLGEGYIIEPVYVDLYEGETSADVLLRVLDSNNITADHWGTTQEGFYLATIFGSRLEAIPDDVSNNIPPVLMKHLMAEGIELDAKSYPDGLGEFDYTYQSGWMYCVNNKFPNVGFADYTLKPGDVMRVQFTLAYGRDIGGSSSVLGGNGENDFYAAPNKDNLTTKIADCKRLGQEIPKEYMDEVVKLCADDISTEMVATATIHNGININGNTLSSNSSVTESFLIDKLEIDKQNLKLKGILNEKIFLIEGSIDNDAITIVNTELESNLELMNIELSKDLQITLWNKIDDYMIVIDIKDAFSKNNQYVFFNPYWYNKFLTPEYIENQVMQYADYSTKRTDVRYNVINDDYVENITVTFNVKYPILRSKVDVGKITVNMLIKDRETYKNGVKIKDNSSLNIGNAEIKAEVTAPAEVIVSYMPAYKVQNETNLSLTYSFGMALPGTNGTGSVVFTKPVTTVIESPISITADADGNWSKVVKTAYSNKDFLIYTNSDYFGLTVENESFWEDTSYNHNANKGLYITFVYSAIPDGTTNATFAKKETVFKGYTYKTNY